MPKSRLDRDGSFDNEILLYRLGGQVAVRLYRRRTGDTASYAGHGPKEVMNGDRQKQGS